MRVTLSVSTLWAGDVGGGRRREFIIREAEEVNLVIYNNYIITIFPF